LCDCKNERYLLPARVKIGTYISCGKCNLAKKKSKHLLRLGTIGNKYGFLTIKDRIDNTTWTAVCDCGKEIVVKRHHLTTKFPSCGCYWKNKRIEHAKKYIGLKWGRLKIIDFLGMHGDDKKTRARYRIRCSCGNILERYVGHMFDIKSCGCSHKDSVPRGENHPHSKITDIESKAIRDIFSSGLYTRKEIASMMNLKYEHICSILK
jgi:hypothetical protein